jgi:protein TonB
VRHGRLSSYSTTAPEPLSINIGRQKARKWGSDRPAEPVDPVRPSVRRGPNSYDLFFRKKEDHRPRKIALIATLLLYPLFLLIHPPARKTPAIQEKPAKLVFMSRWVPPPPPTVERPKQVVREELAARRIPVPDPSPDDPEPLREPERKIVLAKIDPDVEVVIGAPEPPPVAGGPVRAGLGGVTMPVLIESTKRTPLYPELGRKAKLTGSVILEAVVLKDGTVSNIKVLRTPRPGMGFEEAAVDAVKQWRFRPALRNGEAVDVFFTVVVEFELT